MLSDDLEQWDGVEGRGAQERGDMCIHMADHIVVQQKPTPLCKQLYSNKKKIVSETFAD